MRQSEFVPCNFGICYFKLKGLTHGIGKKEKKRWFVEHSCGTRFDTTGCTNEHAIIIGKSSSYLRMCYRNQPGNVESD